MGYHCHSCNAYMGPDNPIIPYYCGGCTASFLGISDKPTGKEHAVELEYAREHWDISDITYRVKDGSIGGWQTFEAMQCGIKGEHSIVCVGTDPICNLAVGDVIILKRGNLTDKRLRVLRNSGGGEMEVKDEWWEWRGPKR